MYQAILQGLKREKPMLIRYVLVGSSSFGVKVGVYALLSRVLWPQGALYIENIIALILAMIYNYTLHRFWTFNHQKPAAGSAGRYIGVVLLGSALDASLFYVGNEMLKIYDFAVLVFNSAFTAFLSFMMHRFFTFHSNPWKRKQNVIQSSQANYEYKAD
ncbi:GtrA family protein [Patescibacteria group bacterium]|nr:GtrA family protein [Patescibacteria group bacterium]MBU1034830.1 GtrA family protein [Patescibacteria group bacterium]MBU1629888.1 GtrA family protein [Patescibacteria group bacterium]MBU1907729.1 GtrA family protein [Patescibacteria group bacterium]